MRESNLVSPDTRLEGPLVFLRRLSAADVSERYVAWLNDPEVNRFLECRHATHDLASVRAYVEGMNNAADRLLLGIFLQADGSHVGNVGIPHINRPNRFCELSVMIGDKRQWGRGIGRQAVALLSDFALAALEVDIVYSDIRADHGASVRVFEHAGFAVAGRIPGKYLEHGQRFDALVLLKRHD